MRDQLNLGKKSVYREGYGIVAKLVMRDKSLSPEAKAIYSYICSFAGSGTTAFPSAELMMNELNMGDKRFYKFRKELINKGYIIILKQRNGNRREKNIYQIEIEPVEHSQNESVQSESFQNESSQNESFQNEGSNSNSNTINSSINNNSKCSSKEPLEEIVKLYSSKSGILELSINPLEIQNMIKLIDEIPVQVIKKGIEEAFKNYKPKFEGDKIKSFNYCEPVIRNLYAKLKVKENGAYGGNKQNSEPREDEHDIGFHF